MTFKIIGYITLKNYLSKLNMVRRVVVGSPFPPDELEIIRCAILHEPFEPNFINLDFFKNIENVIDKLKMRYNNNNTFRSHIIGICVLLSRFPEFKSQFEIVSELNWKHLKIYDEERNKNIILEKDKNKLISFSPEEIKNNLNKLTNINDAIIYAFSVSFLRRLEIRLLKLAYDENDEDNQLIIDIDGYPTKVIFNKYKTATTYKKQIVDIPPEIIPIVMRYIAIKNIEVGDYLFALKKNKNEPISQPNFSIKIKTVFNKLYNANITNRWIRMSYATEMGANAIEIVKKYENDATLLSHSTKVHHQYVKKNM